MRDSFSRRLETLLIQKTLRYKRDEDGSMILFGVFMFLMMLMIGGIAYDLLRNENVRSHLQSLSDTAALAGANLNNTQDPEVVVQDYFNKAGLAGYLKDVKVTQAVNSH
jgi:Flp pilus assembly protein TadG